AERPPRLELPGGDCLDAGTHDLRGVGAEVDHHRRERGLVGPKAEADRGQPEVHEEDLHQERRVADGLDVGAGRGAGGGPTGEGEARGAPRATPPASPSTIASAESRTVSQAPRRSVSNSRHTTPNCRT